MKVEKRLFGLTVLSLMLATSFAFAATSSGLDTPTGSTDMPFAIQGVQVMDLSGAGLAIGTTTAAAAPLEVYDPSGGRTAYFLGPSNSVNVIDVGYGGGANQAVELGYQPSGNYGYLAVLGGSPTINLLSNGNVGIGVGMTNPSYPLEVNGDLRADGWLRTSGQAGWYSDTYGGGWYMVDTTWIRSYGGKYLFEAAGLDTGGPSGIGCNGGLGGGYELQICGAGTLKLNGALYFSDGTYQTTAAHSFGGMWGYNSGSAGPCQWANPMTGGCSCPSGYNQTVGSSLPDHTNSQNTLYYCWK